MERTALFAALATLTARPDSTPLADKAVVTFADIDTLEVRWTQDGGVIRISFEPLTVDHESALARTPAPAACASGRFQ